MENILLNLVNFGAISKGKMLYFLLNIEADKADEGGWGGQEGMEQMGGNVVGRGETNSDRVGNGVERGPILIRPHSRLCPIPFLILSDPVLDHVRPRSQPCPTLFRPVRPCSAVSDPNPGPVRPRSWLCPIPFLALSDPVPNHVRPRSRPCSILFPLVCSIPSCPLHPPSSAPSASMFKRK